MTVITHGPVFDGRAFAEAELAAKAVEREISAQAKDKILKRLPEVLKTNDGEYMSSIHQVSSSLGEMVTDMPIVYGPWLEGVGSRNATTRFKGYHTFRVVYQELSGTAEAVAEVTVAPFVRAMNI